MDEAGDYGDGVAMDNDARIVEYQCIMDVFTLSCWIAQVRAICVNSIKGGFFK